MFLTGLITVPLKAGKLLLAMTPVTSNALAGAIARGSAGVLEKGSTQSYEFGEEQKVSLDVELNQEALFTQTGFATVYYSAMTTYFNSKWQLRRRWVAMANVMRYMELELKALVKNISKLESAVAVQTVDYAEMRYKGASATELLELGAKQIDSMERAFVFSGVDENTRRLQQGLLKLEYLNNPALTDLQQFETAFVGDPSMKEFKRASSLLDKELIAKRKSMGKDIDLYKFLFDTPSTATNTADEIWSLSAVVNNYAAIIDESKEGLVKAKQTFMAGKETAKMLSANLGTGIERADRQLQLTINEAILAATQSTSDILKSTLAGTDELNVAVKTVATKADEVVALSTKVGGKLISRTLQAVSVIDAFYWIGTSIIDIGLNLTGIDEEDQKIPFLSDIPWIGKVFDFGEGKLGGSFIDDLIITPIINFFLEGFLPEEVEATLVDAIWIIIASAATSETLGDVGKAIVEFYVEEINADFEIPTAYNREQTVDNPLFSLIKTDPIVILEYMTYVIVAKIVFSAWVVPSAGFFARQVGFIANA